MHKTTEIDPNVKFGYDLPRILTFEIKVKWLLSLRPVIAYLFYLVFVCISSEKYKYRF